MTMNTPAAGQPNILYQDQDLILIHKNPGLLSVQDGYNPALPHLRSVLEPEFGTLWIVHRLDRETSGVMVMARNAEAHHKLNQSFRERQIQKTYHGLVTPAPDWHEKDIQLPLTTDADRQHRTRVKQASEKAARSICRVMDRCSLGALMEIEIRTGITHQIRAHLRALNIALIGDMLYNAGLPNQPFTVPRMMLHARSLAFNHPTTGEWLQVTAPYPDDFREAYTKLKITTTPETAI